MRAFDFNFYIQPPVVLPMSSKSIHHVEMCERILAGMLLVGFQVVMKKRLKNSFNIISFKTLVKNLLYSPYKFPTDPLLAF